jgi:hypothetical protein
VMKCYTRLVAIPQISTLDSDCGLASVFYKRQMGYEKSVVAGSRVVALGRNGT